MLSVTCYMIGWHRGVGVASLLHITPKDFLGEIQALSINTGMSIQLASFYGRNAKRLAYTIPLALDKGFKICYNENIS